MSTVIQRDRTGTFYVQIGCVPNAERFSVNLGHIVWRSVDGHLLAWQCELGEEQACLERVAAEIAADPKRYRRLAMRKSSLDGMWMHCGPKGYLP